MVGEEGPKQMKTESAGVPEKEDTLSWLLCRGLGSFGLGWAGFGATE